MLTHKQVASNGGKKSAAKLTTAQRAERARLGAAKREMTRLSKRELETLLTALRHTAQDTPDTNIELKSKLLALFQKITQSLSKSN